MKMVSINWFIKKLGSGVWRPVYSRIVYGNSFYKLIVFPIVRGQQVFWVDINWFYLGWSKKKMICLETL
jgi:hypothetical protein